MARTTSNRSIPHPKATCTRCGKLIATTALAQHNHARACPLSPGYCVLTPEVQQLSAEIRAEHRKARRAPQPLAGRGDAWQAQREEGV